MKEKVKENSFVFSISFQSFLMASSMAGSFGTDLWSQPSTDCHQDYMIERN